MSKNKHVIYMGAYSLDHWIDKILNKEILLPPYQRQFVWGWSNKGIRFLDSLQKKLYIPPVTLGDYKGKTYLIDGQQRLTTLFCLKYNFWPIDIPHEINIQQENLDEDVEDRVSIFSKFTFEFIQNIYNRDNDDWIKELYEEKIIEPIKDSIQIEENIFQDFFLSYSHIMWNDAPTDKEQEEFYAHTFDRINTGGAPLTSKDVRKAMYWMYKGLEDKIYNKSFEDNIKINNNSLDYLEYLAIIFARENKALLNSSRLEKYLEQYNSDFMIFLTQETTDKTILSRWESPIKQKISAENYEYLRTEIDKIIPIFNKEKIDSLVNQKNTLLQQQDDVLDSTIPNKIEDIESKIRELNTRLIFERTADADYFLFGLIHHVYNNKIINMDEKESLIDKLKDLKSSPTLDYSPNLQRSSTLVEYNKAPNLLRRIRLRIQHSIEIWQPYMIDRPSIEGESDATEL